MEKKEGFIFKIKRFFKEVFCNHVFEYYIKIGNMGKEVIGECKKCKKTKSRKINPIPLRKNLTN